MELTSTQHGVLMFDLEGLTLTNEEKSLIAEPQVGGIILFSRNFESSHQLFELTSAIRTIKPKILIAVDQEGGRVQRFKGEKFITLPEMSSLSCLYNKQPDKAEQIAFEIGLSTGSELKQHLIDINLAPVLDINRQNNNMLKSRCFGTTSEMVIALTSQYIKGLTATGIHAVGKHFPGHGGVSDDTHISLPKDNRSINEIDEDLKPFISAINKKISGLMPSHIVYTMVSCEPAGFSDYWLRKVLRNTLNFQGVLFSDCLNMAAASVAGGFSQRAERALNAGCDMLLVCNNRQGAKEVLQWLKQYKIPADKSARLETLKNLIPSETVSEARRLALQKQLTKLGLVKTTTTEGLLI